jgi:hypothetical protein
MIDKQEILRQLDEEAKVYAFPMLDNGYYYHGDQKLTIFRDASRWAILLEVLAYNNHMQGLDGITTIANVFGNCLTGSNGNDNFNYFADDNGTETFLYDEVNYIPYLNPQVKSIKIRDLDVAVIFDREHYKAKKITFEYEDKITPWEFMRGLIPEYSNLFWLRGKEISKKIPTDLPVFMTLDNWHHPDLVVDERPSDTQTFQQLADVILTGDKRLYSTSETINTHWTNWPDGGTL